MNPERLELHGRLKLAKADAARFEAEIAADTLVIRQRLNKYEPIASWDIEGTDAAWRRLKETHARLKETLKRVESLERDLG